MRTTFAVAAISIAASSPTVSIAQWSTTGNGGTNPALNFLGTTDGNALVLRTNNIPRTRLFESTAQTINGFPNINQAGYLGIGRNVNTFPVGAYSRLHLGDLSNPNWQGGFRPRDINGITLTGNLDHMYVGQWVEDATFSRTSALIGWSDYSYDAQTPDMLRFQYREQYNSNLPQLPQGPRSILCVQEDRDPAASKLTRRWPRPCVGVCGQAYR